MLYAPCASCIFLQALATHFKESSQLGMAAVVNVNHRFSWLNAVRRLIEMCSPVAVFAALLLDLLTWTRAQDMCPSQDQRHTQTCSLAVWLARFLQGNENRIVNTYLL